ncbi:hypothetical protein WKI23_07445 [Streptococcus pneumoniae]|uniref:hypothetical protein n=1 Tax=Streptococcus pseudopneumoniae TaxID=257758 RepID=UPI0031291973
MRIEFYFTDNNMVEVVNCSEKDVRRLISQFNNGHLMQAGAAHINPKKVLYFFVYEEEATD